MPGNRAVHAVQFPKEGHVSYFNAGNRSACSFEDVGVVINKGMAEQRKEPCRGYKKTRACAQIVVFVEHISVRGVESYPDQILVSYGYTSPVSLYPVDICLASGGLFVRGVRTYAS